MTVSTNESHPEAYAWITIDGRRYFLGVIVPHLTEDGVRAMARDFLDAHPEHYTPR